MRVYAYLHKLLSESEKLKRSDEKIVFHICSVLSLSLLVEKPRCEQALTEILRELIMVYKKMFQFRKSDSQSVNY